MPMIRVWQFCALNGQCWISAVDDWQTMITGVIALIAAGVAYCAAKSQVDTAKKQLEVQQNQYLSDRAGRLRAARASLPLVLSGICDFAEKSILVLRQQIPRQNVSFPHDANIDLDNVFVEKEIQFQDQYVEVLGKIIELSGDKVATSVIEGLIREVQIFHARWRGFRHRHCATQRDLCHLIFQSCVIWARAEIIFNYARGRAADVDESILWDRVFVAMMSSGVDQIGTVVEIAQQQRADNAPPGEAERPLDF